MTTHQKLKRHELKLVLHADTAQRVRTWVAERLQPDPFAGGEGSYGVHSLYCDNAALDVYHRRSGDGGTKYRVRRYGSEDVVWLERKRRKGTAVAKQRVPVPLLGLPDLLQQTESRGFVGEFLAALHQHSYSPRLHIAYTRSAWVGEGDVRLTMDSALEASVIARGATTGAAAGASLFDAPQHRVSITADVVLELKYSGERPVLFAELLRRLAQNCGSFSKYAHGVEVSGLSRSGAR